MSDLVVLGLKLLFLALLWLFVVFAVNVIRTDLFGRPAASGTAGPSQIDSLLVSEPTKAGKKRRGRRVEPTGLHVTEGARAGVSLGLADSMLIGRTPDAALDLGDEFMSSRHALISRTPSGFVIEDLGSTNGTSVNGQRILSPTLLSPGDSIRIGRTTIQVS